MRDNIDIYIENSQFDNMGEDEMSQESIEIMECFKRGLFAKDERVRTSN
jgi:hypothetical protein